MARMKVLVVGGGIGGITCMLALRQRGVDAQLFEQAAAFGQVGAGIQVSSNAARILLKLGLGPALKKVATYPEARDYRGWDTGERLYYTQLGQKAEAHFGSPYYAAHRAELLDVLLSELDEYGVRLGSRVEYVYQDDRGVSLTLADGTTAQGDILVGADGIHSTVRAQLLGKESPRYTGNVAWRGLVPAERVAQLNLGSVVGVWMGPNRSIVQYYVSAGRTFNWIGISRSPQPARESWLAEGKIEDALSEYVGWHSTIRTIIAATPKVLRQALYDREPLPDWQVGRIVLLGDAAHPMLPFYAQGGAQSIEDAYVLAGCIAEGQDRPLAALARFVKMRLPRTAWMQGLARREEELYQSNDAATIKARNERMRVSRTPETATFPPEQEQLYGYDADTELRKSA
ncbi:MAG TPA: FAD-dependent monooxygenase [Pseudolabrys sp.]|jgi:salicylate hydroxylase|nr:FAD-dependent monooxygenase [Pseudolabrys sp.]